jgi:hypothetical protein
MSTPVVVVAGDLCDRGGIQHGITPRTTGGQFAFEDRIAKFPPVERSRWNGAAGSLDEVLFCEVLVRFEQVLLVRRLGVGGQELMLARGCGTSLEELLFCSILMRLQQVLLLRRLGAVRTEVILTRSGGGLLEVQLVLARGRSVPQEVRLVVGLGRFRHG